MKFNLTLVAAVGFLATIVNAGIVTHSPYDQITWTGGNNESVIWADDGNSPKLTDPALSKVTIQLMTGNVKQIVVDTIAKSVPGTAKKVSYLVPKTVGPPGNFYFIKYTAGSYIAFSGRFSIQGVSGTIPGFDPNAPLSDPTNTTAPASNSTDSSSSSGTNSSSNTSGPGSSSSNGATSSGTSAASSLSTPTSKSANSPKPSSSDALPRAFLSTSTFAPLALGVVAIAMTFV